MIIDLMLWNRTAVLLHEAPDTLYLLNFKNTYQM